MTQPSILITGCSSGIGHASALALKKRGYRVFATARRISDVEALITEGLEALPLDVNDAISMQRALEDILKRTDGTLGAIFNNAGFLQAGAVEDLSRDMIRTQFETNVFGPMELIRLVLPIMRKQGYGRIIQNSSILGVVPLPFYGAYNASKFALEGFSRTLRQELQGSGIHVAIINPGPITSKLRKNAHLHYHNTIAIQPGNAHANTYLKMETTYFKPSKRDQRAMLPPDAVTKQLIHALESRHPKTHYFVGLTAQALAIVERLLPNSTLDWLLTKAR